MMRKLRKNRTNYGGCWVMTPFGIISLEVSLYINFRMVGGHRFLRVRKAEQEKEPAEPFVETAEAHAEEATEKAEKAKAEEDKKDRIILLHI
jgi:hypothetical protein